VRIAISTPVTARSATVIGVERAGACSRSLACRVWLPFATAAIVNAPRSSVVAAPVSLAPPRMSSLAVTCTLAIGLPVSSTTRPETGKPLCSVMVSSAVAPDEPIVVNPVLDA